MRDADEGQKRSHRQVHKTAVEIEIENKNGCKIKVNKCLLLKIKLTTHEQVLLIKFHALVLWHCVFSF